MIPIWGLRFEIPVVRLRLSDFVPGRSDLGVSGLFGPLSLVFGRPLFPMNPTPAGRGPGVARFTLGVAAATPKRKPHRTPQKDERQSSLAVPQVDHLPRYFQRINGRSIK